DVDGTAAGARGIDRGGVTGGKGSVVRPTGSGAVVPGRFHPPWLDVLHRRRLVGDAAPIEGAITAAGAACAGGDALGAPGSLGRSGLVAGRRSEEVVVGQVGHDDLRGLVFGTDSIGSVCRRTRVGSVVEVWIGPIGTLSASLLDRVRTDLLCRVLVGLLDRVLVGLLCRVLVGLLDRVRAGLLDRVRAGLLCRVLVGRLPLAEVAAIAGWGRLFSLLVVGGPGALRGPAGFPELLVVDLRLVDLTSADDGGDFLRA